MCEIQIYSQGVVCLSVCVPFDVSWELIEQEVNLLHPTGIRTKWEISNDKAFVSGETNPY